MKKKLYFWYLLWLLPLYLSGMAVHMAAIYTGLGNTYENGQSYLADVIHFEIKQIAAQTNGSITVRFTPDNSAEIIRKLSQPIQNAAQLQASEIMPVRYLEGSYQPIVLVPIYDFHRRMVLVNLGVLILSVLITIFIALTAHRHVRRQRREEEAIHLPVEIINQPAHQYSDPQR